jgi:ribosome recycling factor
MAYQEISKASDQKMKTATDVLLNDLRGVRTGRASASLVDDIKIDYYGTPTPLKQMAAISTPEPRLIVIKPFDISILSTIEKTIQKSDIGINPINDGKLIRLAVPPLSEERRKQLAKLVKDKTEEARVSIRNVRRDANRQADEGEKNKTLSEDEKFRLKEDLNKLAEKHEKDINDILDKKTKEIMGG